ncbi:MAG: hypothetical protein WC516_08050 [Patescibacteria group bacterium]|jgi:hypothetical protein
MKGLEEKIEHTRVQLCHAEFKVYQLQVKLQNLVDGFQEEKSK